MVMVHCYEILDDHINSASQMIDHLGSLLSLQQMRYAENVSLDFLLGSLKISQSHINHRIVGVLLHKGLNKVSR